MAPSGWGVDPTKLNGVVTGGTEAADVRKVWSALYNPGIITGAAVTASSTNMNYTVTTGVAVIPISSTESVIAPIPSGTITGSAATNRTDIIYAKQNIPTVEGNSSVVIGVATSLPARSIALRQFAVQSGNTRANQGVATGGIDYAVPYGSSGKILHQYRDTSNSAIGAIQTAGTGSFYLPTDRKVQISISACVSSLGASGFDNSKYCEVIYQPYINNIKQYTWNTGGLHQAYTVYQFEAFADLARGNHTAHYTFRKELGAGTPVRHHVGGESWPGTYFVIRDAGVID